MSAQTAPRPSPPPVRRRAAAAAGCGQGARGPRRGIRSRTGPPRRRTPSCSRAPGRRGQPRAARVAGGVARRGGGEDRGEHRGADRAADLLAGVDHRRRDARLVAVDAERRGRKRRREDARHPDADDDQAGQDVFGVGRGRRQLREEHEHRDGAERHPRHDDRPHAEPRQDRVCTVGATRKINAVIGRNATPVFSGE